MHYLAAFVLALLVGVFSRRAKLLSRSGSIATFFLAFLVYSLGGWEWTAPIFAFFLLSSLLSKLGREKKDALAETFEKTGTRDAWQVVANGGLAGCALICEHVFPGVHWYTVYLSIIAAVTADTWSTEIGVLSPDMPRSILTGQRIAHGLSGGISLPGFAGGTLGAFAIALIGHICIPLGTVQFIIVVFSGIAGNVADSLLGASLQAAYRCTVCGAATERTSHCGSPSELVSGYLWMRNDTVNVLSSFAAAIAALIAVFLFPS